MTHSVRDLPAIAEPPRNPKTGKIEINNDADLFKADGAARILWENAHYEGHSERVRDAYYKRAAYLDHLIVSYDVKMADRLYARTTKKKEATMSTGYTTQNSPEGITVTIHSDHGFHLSAKLTGEIHERINDRDEMARSEHVRLIDTMTAHLNAQKVWLQQPKPNVEALVVATRKMADDYQYSIHHHPEHILVRKDHFDEMRKALDIEPAGELKDIS